MTGDDTVLVIGSEGYVGTVLCARLAELYRVAGLDAGFYKGGWLYPFGSDTPPTKRRDVRQIEPTDFEGVTAVVCLADLTDPTSQAWPELARSVGYDGLARLASLARDGGVRRFVYASSASIYGRSCDSGPLTEEGPTGPLTVYAECKERMERHLLSLNSPRFAVTCLRNATIYGASPRMRFDLVVNQLCGSAVALGSIQLATDGSAWRPFVHIEDVCDVVRAILSSPVNLVSGVVLNVGDGASGNWRVLEVARFIAKVTGCSLIVDASRVDDRSYRLDTTRLNSLGIECRRSLEEEIPRLVELLATIGLDEDVFRRDEYDRLRRLRRLQELGLLDDSLFWSGKCPM